jgi:glucose-1-phosphate cytidylyltransferase
MQVVILCGGQGTRLRELTEVTPKPMIEVGGRPILWHIMKGYSYYGVRDFILCLGYKGDVIRQYFLQYGLMHNDFTIELGNQRVTRHTANFEGHDWRVRMAETGPTTMTGGRLKRIQEYIEDDTFLVTYGDGVADVDIGALIALHRQEGCIATVTAVRLAARFGELVLEENRACSFREKPKTQEGWINGGFFVFNKAVFDYLPDDDCILEREPMTALAQAGQLAAYRHEGFWYCMDTARDVEYLNAKWADGDRPWAVWERR